MGLDHAEMPNFMGSKLYLAGGWYSGFLLFEKKQNKIKWGFVAFVVVVVGFWVFLKIELSIYLGDRLLKKVYLLVCLLLLSNADA